MTSNRQGQEQQRVPPDAAMSGVLALLVDEREQRVKDDREATKTEVLLFNAGLSVDEIVGATGKNAGAIRKAIQRARAR